MSCRPLDVESFRNRARLPKGITRRKRAGYDESKKVSRTLLIQGRIDKGPGFIRIQSLFVSRGISSVGRALAWHARGQGFKSPILHFQINDASAAESGNNVVPVRPAARF